MIKQLSILTLILTFACSAFGQSRTVQSFEKQADGYNVFLYQSLIRVLNSDENPDFNMMIRNLDHLRLLTTESIGEDAKMTFKDLDQDIQAEGFESIMTFDNKDYKCHVYELADQNGKSTWVATLFMEGRAGLIEMKGSVDMNYLHALQSLNTEKLQELLPIDEIHERP